MTEKIEIISGPSREELFDTLRLSEKISGSMFTLKTPAFPKGKKISGQVKLIQSINIPNREWRLELFFTTRDIESSGLKGILPNLAHASYSTQKRRGEIFINKIDQIISPLGVHTIDLDTDPFSFNGRNRKIKVHKKGGQFVWNPSKLDLYFPKQEKIDLSDLLEMVKDMPTINANMLDYLLDHQTLIPKEWRTIDYKGDHGIYPIDRKIIFLGTVYGEYKSDRTQKQLIVRGMFFKEGHWQQISVEAYNGEQSNAHEYSIVVLKN